MIFPFLATCLSIHFIDTSTICFYDTWSVLHVIFTKNSSKKIRLEIWTFSFQIFFQNHFLTLGSGQTENYANMQYTIIIIGHCEGKAYTWHIMHGMLQVTYDTLHLMIFFLFQKVPKMAKKAITSQNMKKCQKVTKNTKSVKKVTKITKSAKKKVLNFLEFQCFGDTIQPHEKCKCLP